MISIQPHDLDHVAGGTAPSSGARRIPTDPAEMPVCPIAVPFPEI